MIATRIGSSGRGRLWMAGVGVLALLASTSASAQDPRRTAQAAPLPGIGSADPRRPADIRQMPWRALGRVQTEVGGRCTGVMVATNRVLTAAHCLVSPTSRQFVQPNSIHFLLGYERGDFAARARVASYVIGQGYAPDRGPSGADWALLVLEQPIAAADRILPLIREAPAPRTPVMLGGYQQDRPEVLMADTACRLLGLQRQPSGHQILVHDCAGTRGSSGAPLLALMPDGRRWGVVGVLSVVSPDMALGQAVPAGSVAQIF